MKIRITNFAKRHFTGKGGTQIRNFTVEQIEQYVNQKFSLFGENLDKGAHIADDPYTKGLEYLDTRLIEGYADFCKLLIVPNLTDARTGTVKITNENAIWMRDGFHSRVDWELPVLTRALHLPMPTERAKYLVFVLYKNDHLIEEHKVRMETQFKQSNEKRIKEGKEPLSESDWASLSTIDGLKYEFEGDEDVEWGVVSIMGQMVNIEEPMQPATMIRNHMGKEFGGSGVELDRDAYLRSVEFWKDHAIVR
jgi:hypothetical protein